MNVVQTDAEGAGLAEYRLEDLREFPASALAISALIVNAGYSIRRGASGARRGHGERHLHQLTSISQLLAKGSHPAHIAEFFPSRCAAARIWPRPWESGLRTGTGRRRWF